MAELGVGQQTNEYAQQFNDLSALDDNPVAMQRKAAAKANAQALAEKAAKAGAKPPSFKAAVKETAPEEKPADKSAISPDNPFAKYATAAKPAVSSDNPFAKYAVKAEADAATEPEEKGPEPLLKHPMVSPTGATSAIGSLVDAVGSMFSGPSALDTEVERGQKMYDVRAKGGSLGEMHKAGGGAEGSPVAQGFGMSQPELAAPVGKAVVAGAKAPFAKAADIVKSGTGVTEKKLTEGVRGKALEQAEKAVTAEELAASIAGKKADVLAGQKDQVLSRQGLNAQGLPRAELATKPSPPGQIAGNESKNVKTVLDERVAALTKKAEEAGATTEAARTKAEEHVAREKAADDAVTKLEEEYKTRGASTSPDAKENFGTDIYKTAAKMKEETTEKRQVESGYKKALEEAGDAPIVDTTGALDVLDSMVKKTRGEAPMGDVLSHIQKRLQTTVAGENGDEVAKRVSASVADSTRKYIATIIRAKQMGATPVDQETAAILRQISSALKQPLYEASDALRVASQKWAELSKPLDVFGMEGAKKGGLKGVLSSDPYSTEAAMEMSNVVGSVIKKANAGNGVFERLLAETPDLRESARLYFTRDLFGAGKVPSQGALNEWLNTNRGSLHSLGLYDEFSNIARARETAKRAASEAGDDVKQTAAEAKKATQDEAGIRKDLAKQNKIRVQHVKNMEATGKGTPTAEDLKAKSASRADKAAQGLDKRREGVLKEKEKAESAADAYKQFETKLQSTVEKRVVPETRSLIDKMRKDGRIDDEMYKDLLDQVNKAETEGLRGEKIRNRMKNLVYAGVAGWGGIEAYRGMRSLLGW